MTLETFKKADDIMKKWRHVKTDAYNILYELQEIKKRIEILHDVIAKWEHEVKDYIKGIEAIEKEELSKI